ncbi:MAG: hypothetical protein SF066_06290 [Thermoanaerobaculia bacterium]|nr:hypothetical protein [Thermoanaerobaculia bacterium]
MDDLVLSRLRAEAERSGKGYQALINETLSRAVPAPPPSGRLAEECAKLDPEWSSPRRKSGTPRSRPGPEIEGRGPLGLL